MILSELDVSSVSITQERMSNLPMLAQCGIKVDY